MYCLIKLNSQVQQECEESVYEFGYYFWFIPWLGTYRTNKNTKRLEIIAFNEAMPTQDENSPLVLPSEESQKLQQEDSFETILSQCYRIQSYKMDIHIS